GKTSPANPDPLVQALDEGGWQQCLGAVEQLPTRLPLGGLQPVVLQPQAHLCTCTIRQREKQAQQTEPGEERRMDIVTWTAAIGLRGRETRAVRRRRVGSLSEPGWLRPAPGR